MSDPQHVISVHKANAPVTAPDAPACLPVCILVALAYIFWAVFGFISGLHTVVLLLAAMCSRADCSTVAFLCQHFALHWVGVIGLAIGGGYSRSGTYTGCPGNETMSRECLVNNQTIDYQAAYIIHFIAGGYFMAQWASDAWCIVGWSRQIISGAPITCFGVAPIAHDPLQPWFAVPQFHWLLTLGNTAIVSLIWTCIVDWRTGDASLVNMAVGIFVIWGVFPGLCLAAVCLVMGRAQSSVTPRSPDEDVQNEGERIAKSELDLGSPSAQQHLQQPPSSSGEAPAGQSGCV